MTRPSLDAQTRWIVGIVVLIALVVLSGWVLATIQSPAVATGQGQSATSPRLAQTDQRPLNPTITFQQAGTAQNRYRFVVTYSLSGSPATTVTFDFSDGITKTVHLGQPNAGGDQYRATVTRSFTVTDNSDWWREKGQKTISVTAQVTTTDGRSGRDRLRNAAVTTYEVATKPAITPTFTAVNATRIETGQRVRFRLGWEGTDIVPNAIQQGIPVTVKFGDGTATTVTLLSPTTVTHVYRQPGTYSATATVETRTAFQAGNPFAGFVRYTTDPIRITVTQRTDTPAGRTGKRSDEIENLRLVAPSRPTVLKTVESTSVTITIKPPTYTALSPPGTPGGVQHPWLRPTTT